VTPQPECRGNDGLRVRESGEWAKEKLDFLSHYGPVALTATARMPQRYYVDLFAGPGLNRVRNGTEEFDGSPLRVIELSSDRAPVVHFTEAWLVNRDRRDHSALEHRIQRRIDEHRSHLAVDRIHCIRGDANARVRSILDATNPRSYMLVFADMESPKQCPWSSIASLRTHRSHGSVDLYILFPLGMALKRLMSRNNETVLEATPVLDAFFGTDAWRALLALRQIDSQANSEELGRGLLELYIRQLHQHWKHVDVVGTIARGTNHRLYKMLFASNHDAGKRIAAWAKRRAPAQLGLQFG